MQLFHGVMTKDTRVRSTNHPTSKFLERVVVTPHGDGKRKDSGNYLPHKDFKNVKTRFLYKFPNSNLPAVTNSEDILENMVLESFDNLF